MRPLALAAALSLPISLSASACGDGYHSVGLFDKVDTTIGGNKSAVAVGVGDLDGDGRGDVVVADSNNQIDVLISKGDGTFASGISYPLPVNFGMRTILIVDVNGDGHADVLVGNLDAASVTPFLNQGDGKLVAAQQSMQNVGCNMLSMLLYDMNADGKPDLVVGCRDSPFEIHVLKNQGPGQGQSALTNIGFGGQYTHKILVAADNNNPPALKGFAVGLLNGNSMPDIAVATANDVRILNDPKETQQDFNSYQVSVPISMAPLGIGLGDVNGNGIMDVSALLDAGKSVQVFEYATGGTYNQRVVYSGLDTGGYNSLNSLAMADMSNDGKTDYILASNGGGGSLLKLAISRGESGMVPSPVIASYNEPLMLSDGSLSLGDVNGDGNKDLVLRNGPTISVVLSAAR